MFLLPARGNLRSEGLADEWYESKDFHCGEFEPNSLLEVLRPEEMQSWELKITCLAYTKNLIN